MKVKSYLTLVLVISLLFNLFYTASFGLSGTIEDYRSDDYMRVKRVLEPDKSSLLVGDFQDISYTIHGDEFEIRPEIIQEKYLIEKEIVLVIDSSGSMENKLEGNKSRMDVVKECAVNFINNFKGKKAKIGIVEYFGRAGRPTGLKDMKDEDDVEDLIEYVNGIDEGGSTNIGDGMRRGYWMLDDDSEAAQYIIIMTDGEPNYYTTIEKNSTSAFRTNSGRGRYFYYNKERATDYAVEIGKMIAGDSITPFIIGFTTGTSNELQNIALACGAAEVENGNNYYVATSSVDINDIYNNQIKNQIISSFPIKHVEFEQTFPEGVKVKDVPEGFDLEVLEGGSYRVTGEIENMALVRNESTGKYSVTPWNGKISVEYENKGVFNLDELAVSYTDPFEFEKDAVIEDEITVVVKQPVTSLVVEPQYLNVKKGQMFDITAEVQPDNADEKDVVWTSSNEGILKIESTDYDESTGVSSVRVKALETGNAYIEAAPKDSDYKGAPGLCTVNVYDGIDGVTGLPDELILMVGEEYELNAVTIPERESSSFSWTSSMDSIVTVDGSGVIKAESPGEASITATYMNAVSGIMGVRPLVLEDDDFAVGEKIVLSKDGSGGKGVYQPISLGGSGYDTLRNNIIYGSGDNIKIGDTVSSEPAVADNAGAVMSELINNNNGSFVITVPLIASMGDPDESNNYDIAGFASFEIKISSGGQIEGEFLGRYSDSCNVKAVNIVINGNDTLELWKSAELTVDLEPAGIDIELTPWVWTSSDEAVLEVDSATGAITAKEIGSAIVNARAQTKDGKEIYGTKTITVLDPEIDIN